MNIPTHFLPRQKCPAEANHQFDYTFASRGYHEEVMVRPLNGIDEWDPRNHCRLAIEIRHG